MKGKQHILKTFRILRKVIFWLLTSLATILLISLLLLQTSFFQNYITNLAISEINGRTREHAKIANIKIKWFDYVQISGLELEDYEGNPMLSASSLDIDYQLNHLIVDGNLQFDKVTLETGQLAITNYQDTLNINLVEFISDLQKLVEKPKDTTRKAPVLKFSNIRLNDFYFSYDNHLRDSLPQGLFDYSHFKLDIPAASILDFQVHRDTIQAYVRSFEAKDQASGLDVNKLTTNFQISNAGMLLEDLFLETENSVIRDYIEFTYSGFSDLGNFVDSVSLNMNLIGSVISKKDLSLFAEIPLEDFKVDITSKISGNIPRLSFDDLRIATGDRTHLYGNFNFWGLPKIDETFIDAQIDDGELFHQDLIPFIGQETSSQLDKLGSIDFEGRFMGFINDFVANASFHTSQGDITSDLNLKIPENREYASYSGKIALDNFNVGAILKDTLKVGRVSMKGTIEGRGVTKETAKFYLNADLEKSSFMGYSYNKISAKGDFASESFKGDLIIDDENCDIKMSGAIDLSKGSEKIEITSEINTLNFQKLGFSEDPLGLAANINADIKGLNIDSLQGDIRMDKIQLTFQEDSLQLDSLIVSSFKDEEKRSIDINLPDVNLSLNGDFLFSTLIRDFRKISTEVVEYFATDFEKRRMEESPDEYDQYSIDFTLDYKDINEYLHLLTSDVYLSNNGHVEGTYYQRKNATLSFFTEVDSINYQGIGYNNNSLDVNLSKDLDSMGIIASVYLISEDQIWRTIDPTKNLELEAVWYNNRINLNFGIEQPETRSSADVSAELKLMKEQLIFNFLPSRLIAENERWYFNPYNQITVSNSHVQVDRLELYQNEQSILLKGRYSDSLETNLSVEFSDFNLEILNTILPTKIAGVLNSTVDLSRENQADPYKLISDINISKLGLNDFQVGDLSGSTEWNPEELGLKIDLNITRESVKTVAVNGFYYPQDSINQLDIESKFNGAELGLAQPLFTGLFSNLRGYADGNMSLSGSFSRPVLTGKTTINEGRLTFDYLGTTYNFDGGLSFNNKSINFDAIRLTDRENDRASLSGTIRHDGFQDFDTDIKIAASNFSFLNTTSTDNSLYYGTANASGDISISGPFEDLLIKASVSTEKGTKLYIPLSSESDVTQKSYISFVDFSDTTNQVNIEEIVRQSISGVRLDFDIDVTTDAYVELIFNIRTGDIIRGRGNGNLNLTLDTNGEFELFGDLTISEGQYNFTIPNFINKEFVISPGSTISWYGDPYTGVLDLDATYRQLASFNDFRPSPNQDAVSQKYPVLVVLNLNGEMLSPTIDFEIRLDESQAVQSTDQQIVLSQINNDDSELKRQVFSLLILRKFTQEQGFSVGAASAGVNSSVSEFLSNQFSYFISQVDENLEVDVDLSSMDANAFNTFQMRISYSFLDGRLQVSGGGSFPQQSAEDASATSFVGDWSVRYILTPDGHLRVKAFSKSEQIAGSQQRETGVSFQYVNSFDDFKELLRKSREASVNTKSKDVSKEIEANEKVGT